MDNLLWVEHILQWKQFLEKRLYIASNQGEREKALRQLKAINQVQYAVVGNPKLLQEFINPQNIADENEEISFFLDLNESQKRAVKVALGANVLSLIQGPPGTGKTQVIAEICLQLYKRNQSIKILVCSETHVAVNNLISRVFEYDKSLRIVRVRDKEQNTEVDEFSPRYIADDYIKWLNEYYIDLEVKKIVCDSLVDTTDKSFEKALALSANITGMTCNRVGAYDFGEASELFDVVIIDEVCKATLPEILIPLEVAKKAILVGDPKQLPPVFCTEELDIIKNIEECELQKYMYVDKLFEVSKCTTILDIQYRMIDSIGSMISELFYNGELKNARKTVSKNAIIWLDYRPSRMWPLPVEGENSFQLIKNMDECRIITQILSELNQKCEKEKTVGIITPYRHQAMELRKGINQYENIRIIVDTVDGFQGKECDTIIFSVTRTTGSFRFMADNRRLNVALSRAREKIMIVGNLEYAQRHTLLKKISEYSRIVKVE